jgi:hypothetical protein
MACSGDALEDKNREEAQGRYHGPLQCQQSISFKLRRASGRIKGKRDQGPDQEQQKEPSKEKHLCFLIKYSYQALAS